MAFLSGNGEFISFQHKKTPAVMRYTHVHPRYEIYFCPESIEQISVINGVDYIYSCGAVIISAPYTIHSMSCSSQNEGTFERYIFYVGRRSLENMDKSGFVSGVFEKNVGLLFKLTQGETEELREIAELCHKCRSTKETEIALALFLNRLLALCPSERISKVGQPSFYIQDVLRYVSENLNKKINITEIAERFSVSRSKLDRDFKKFTGMTLHSYLDICRINQAKYLLDHKRELTVGDVAAMCGFESESCFFHFFKKMMGKTPSEFKKEKQ